MENPYLVCEILYRNMDAFGKEGLAYLETQAELDGLEQAITAFLQKFNSPAGAGVVKLDAERELRQTAG